MLGNNAKGTLGVPDAGTGTGIAPVEALPPGTAADLTVVAYHACVVTAATPSQVLCWGENGSGQAGVAGAVAVPSPTALAISDASQVVAGAFFTCIGRSTSPAGECMGENVCGELGLGPGDGGANDGATDAPSGTDSLPHPVPAAVALPALSLRSFFHSAGYHMGAVFVSGEFAMWGANNNNQLGPHDESDASNPTPTIVTALSEVTAMAMAMTQYATCALRADGTVWCWGSTADGQTGTANTGVTQVTPSQVVALPEAGATGMSAGLTHVCALAAGGDLYCWGFNGNGQLGRNTSVDFDPTPARVVF